MQTKKRFCGFIQIQIGVNFNTRSVFYRFFRNVAELLINSVKK